MPQHSPFNIMFSKRLLKDHSLKSIMIKLVLLLSYYKLILKSSATKNCYYSTTNLEEEKNFVIIRFGISFTPWPQAESELSSYFRDFIYCYCEILSIDIKKKGIKIVLEITDTYFLCGTNLFQNIFICSVHVGSVLFI